MSPDDLLARLLYRDGQMLVVDKPAGIPVHAGTGGGETLDAHFDALRFGLPHPPLLAHRLDRDTSGCLVLGRHRRATAELGRMFASQTIGKTYLAVVQGTIEAEDGDIDAPLSKASRERHTWRMTVAGAGQPAFTRFRVLARGGGLTVVDLTPLTGRTHQLRVHMAHIGYPIVGDSLYGGERAREANRRLHLHARRIVVPFYRNKPPVVVNAPVPAHMVKLLEMAELTPAEGSFPATDA
jgi:RluA family pseudouridine synthase